MWVVICVRKMYFKPYERIITRRPYLRFCHKDYFFAQACLHMCLCVSVFVSLCVYVCVLCVCVVCMYCVSLGCVCVMCVNEKEKENAPYISITELCVCGLFVVVVLVCLYSDSGVYTVLSLTQHFIFTYQFAHSSVIRVFAMSRVLLCHS